MGVYVLFLTERVLFSSAVSQEHLMTLLLRSSLPGWAGSHLTRLEVEVEMAGARRRRWASVGWKISMLDLGPELVSYDVQQLGYQWRVETLSTLDSLYTPYL